jgi:hypothetical protein
MPFTLIDKTNTLLNSKVQEISINIPQLESEWTISSQILGPEGIESRSFQELEFGDDPATEDYPKWVILPGNPAGKTGYSRYYKLESPMRALTYSSSKTYNGNLGDFSDFNGWNYTAQDYSITSIYTDDLVRTVLWKIYDDAFYDIVEVYGPVGEVEGVFYTNGTSSSLIHTLTTRGAAATAIGSEGFIITSGISKNIPLGQTAPTLLDTNILTIERPVVTRSYVPPDQEPTLLKSIYVSFYGKFWLQTLSLSEIYEQGWVVHPINTDEQTRLKPPGKSYLNANFINEDDGIKGVLASQV